MKHANFPDCFRSFEKAKEIHLKIYRGDLMEEIREKRGPDFSLKRSITRAIEFEKDEVYKV